MRSSSYVRTKKKERGRWAGSGDGVGFGVVGGWAGLLGWPGWPPPTSFFFPNFFLFLFCICLDSFLLEKNFNWVTFAISLVEA